VEPLRAGSDRTVLCITIRTGVTHQIRAHLASVGHPVFGDVQYAGPDGGLPPGEIALHAIEIQLPPLGTASTRRLGTPLPPRFGPLLADTTVAQGHAATGTNLRSGS